MRSTGKPNNQSKKTSRNNTTPRRINSTSKRKRTVDASFFGVKTRNKRALIVAPCDVWHNNKPQCRYCNRYLRLHKQDAESHLLYRCKAIPDSEPLVKSKRRHPKGLMARLAAISAVPDPGGEII